MRQIINKELSSRPCLARWCKYLLLLFSISVLAGKPANAADKILIIASNDDPLYTEFIASFKQYTNTPAFRKIGIAVVTLDEQNLSDNTENASLLLAVGVRATEAAINLHGQQPILSALVPRITIEALKDRLKPGAPLFAIYLDQPPARQLRLIRAVLPDADRIGIPLGTFSSHLANEFLAAAAKLQLDLLLTQTATDPLAAVVDALPSCDAILALPDAGVYNQSTVRAILLSTFRADVPVFGYSAAFVEAGALAGLYSSPAQIGRQAVDLSDRILTGQSVPETSYPEYFTVATNPRIAQVLNIELASDENLHKAIMSGEQ